MRGRLKKHTQNAQNQEFPFFACPCVGVAVGLLEVILAAKRLFLSLGGCVMSLACDLSTYLQKMCCPEVAKNSWE